MGSQVHQKWEQTCISISLTRLSCVHASYHKDPSITRIDLCRCRRAICVFINCSAMCAQAAWSIGTLRASPMETAHIVTFSWDIWARIELNNGDDKNMRGAQIQPHSAARFCVIVCESLVENYIECLCVTVRRHVFFKRRLKAARQWVAEALRRE